MAGSVCNAVGQEEEEGQEGEQDRQNGGAGENGRGDILWRVEAGQLLGRGGADDAEGRTGPRDSG